MTEKPTQQSIYGFDDRWFRIIGIPLVALLLPVIFFSEALSEMNNNLWVGYLEAIFYTVIYWEGDRWIVGKMRIRMPALEQSLKRNLWQLLIVTIYGSLVTFVVGGTITYLNLTSHSHQSSPWRVLIAALFVSYLITLIYEAIYFFRLWEKAIIEKERFRREAAQAQYAGLKAQLNPHFLFNSLNVLSYTIPEAPDRAVNMVQKLAQTYRYVLESEQRETVSLEEELQFLSAYSALLKERFGENFQLKVNLPASWGQFHVLPLSLQLLVENAVKHNIIASAHPLKMEIRPGENETILIQNAIRLRRNSETSTGIGLENIRRRYAFYSDTPVRISKEENYFTVELPVLKMA
jgi:two-component system LytT family sensor kinase